MQRARRRFYQQKERKTPCRGGFIPPSGVRIARHSPRRRRKAAPTRLLCDARRDRIAGGARSIISRAGGRRATALGICANQIPESRKGANRQDAYPVRREPYSPKRTR